MLSIEKFECNMFQENCYIVSDESKECIIIDCGAFYEEERCAVVNYIKDNGLTPVHLISTHGHIDHNFGNNTIADNFKLMPEVSSKDEILMNNLASQAKAFIGLEYNVPIPAVGKYFDENYIIEFGSHTMTVLPTPGHTPGSVMLFCKEENVVFSGDTLFKMSIGRTDFQLGSYKDIIESLKHIVGILPADTTVLPGHGDKTTIGFEATHNPFIK